MGEISTASSLWTSELSVHMPPGFERLQHSMGRMATRLSNDPYSQAYLRASQRAIDRHSPYGIALEQFVALRGIKTSSQGPGLTVSNAININRSIAHAYYLDKHGERFYEGLDTPLGWTELDEIVPYLVPGRQGHDDELTEHLSTYFLSGTSQTSVGQRYALLDLYLQTHREELGNEVSVLDVGPGMLIGSKQLAHKDRFPFGHITVTTGNPQQHSTDERHSQELTDKVNNDLLLRPSQLEVSHGVDIMDPTLPMPRRWGRACLRIKDELDDPTFMRRYDEILDLQTPKVDYAVCDFSSFESMRKFYEKFPGKKYDVVFLSMVAHQVSRDEFKNMLAMARLLGKPKSENSPGAKILLFDFAYGPSIGFYLDWYRRPFRARLFEIDPETGKGTEILRSSGRGEKIAVHAGKTAIKGRHVPTTEAIMAA